MGVLKCYTLHGGVIPKELPDGVVVLPDTRNPGEVRTEKVLMAKLYHGGKVF